MSGMIDGVNKAFLLRHRHGAMDLHGFKDERAMVETMMAWTPVEETPEQRIAWLEAMKGKVDEAILRMKKDYEIDGHKWSDDEVEARRG